MTDEDTLRAAFGDGVPAPPPAPDRAAGARRRARVARQRRAAAVVGASALVVGLVATAPALLDRDRASAPRYASSPGDLPCPRYSPEVTEGGPDDVADDLVAARLCSGPGLGHPASAEVLTTGLDRIPPLVNDAPDHDSDSTCTMDLGRGYVLQLLHADGTTQAVSGELYGCGVTTAGGTRRVGAQALYDQVAELYTAQRGETDPGCPAGPVEPPASGPAALPTGATGVRLCQGPGTTFQVPVDSLTSDDVGRLVALVNSSRVKPPVDGCDLDLGPGYSLVFGYADGSTQVVTGELYGCHDLRVGGVAREDPEGLLDAFVVALRTQRDESPGDTYVAPPELTCPDPDVELSLVGRADEMRQAVLCVRFDRPGASGSTPVLVRGADLSVLLADLRDPSRRTDAEIDSSCLLDQPYLYLVGATGWGDRVMFEGYCGFWDLNGSGTFVLPSAASKRILERLVSRSGFGP